ncbi:ORF6N domain-containing protein [Algoriphagus sp. AGSA1]|uniref:ORF6N domain-containing protein n=1 Tax=Algoriphagus sp. AGSA1 TaxID=2907213 RepID=UPI001F2C6FCA|nr:ORF6N domain-containing protein [Algoriphagus sp. AGSA1]MCE7057231.1 ORF6N domain-containing protein [Algoriphagus sp. AGSA1]
MELTISDIENRIFTIRGNQVMVDRDLSDLYQVDTKVLNQAVKRNSNRFPEPFRFQLTKEEKMEPVTNCDRLESLKHSSSNPYVFTEQGVAMLSAVLRSEVAVNVSIQIMQAFLYLSRYIIQNKKEYYHHLQAVRDQGDWEGWLLFMIQGVESTALHTQQRVLQIKQAMMDLKNILRQNYKFYSQDLLNHLFNHPYTRIEYVQQALMLKSRQTAAAYLNQLATDGVLIKKEGRPNYYINPYLINALANDN